MQVRRVHVSRYTVPLPRVAEDATHGSISCFSLITVRARTRDGVEGVGYTYTVGRTGGAAIASVIADDLVPVVLNRDSRRIEQIWRSMHQATHYLGHGGPTSFAISAMDIALWDIKAKAVREPLWRLLGAADPNVQAYAGGIDLNLPIDELEAQTRASLKQGFRAIKMKVGRPRLREDVERVLAMRHWIGPDAPLMVDANMKWTVEEAIKASHAFAEHDVYWLEEPTAPWDVPGHVRIQREGALPVAAGENLRTLPEFEGMISAGGVAFPEPDVSNCGGITGWMKVARLAEARNLPVTSHGVHDLHVSLLAAVPNASFLEVHGFGLDTYLRMPLTIRAGCATPPEAPGHGVQFRWNLLREHLEN